MDFKTFINEGRGGGPDHLTIGRMMNPGLNRKNQNFKANGPKPKINPIVDLLIKNNSKIKIIKNIPIAMNILKDYNIKHTSTPYIKALKNTGYYIKYNLNPEEEPFWIVFKR